MRYFSAALIVLGFAIVGGAEAHAAFPMFVTQIIVGTLTTASGVMFAIDVDKENDE